MEFIKTEKAPAAIGPYSQGIKVDGFIYTSGQLPIDMETGEQISSSIDKATKACLENVLAIVEAGGGSLDSIVKVTVFVDDIDDFSAINDTYAAFFGDHAPARSLVEVAKLPKKAIIEIEAVAQVK